ncbi:hypothetical protein JCGZ_14550 [Jatropha curcas]|uniref:Pectinesterase n=1 Tax=Jatropha curcas TaxID=180498 RepID=A0A067KAE9_JATCU|nr:hypothetical protein JCGZ_14550 [Jatropha curcas]
MATSSSFCLQGLEAIQMAQNQIAQVRNWATQTLQDDDSNHVSVPFNDCVKLYSESEFRLSQLLASENYTRDDTRTWLSGVLANHKTCLNGLNEKGFLQTQPITRNLTFWLNEALAFYRKGRGKRNVSSIEGVPLPGRPINNHGGGILTSWDPATSKADFTVARDGSGTHRTINDAVAALNRMVKGRSQRIIIHVKAGVYNEKVEIEKHHHDVMLVGDGIGKTIITGSRNVRDGDSTLSSATFGVSGDGFWARDITFENIAGPNKHQAVALRVSADRSVFYRCSIQAYQDTLYVHSLRQFYRDCQIYGTVDFIFGDASVIFQNCDIFVKRPMNGQTNYITAQGRDNPNEITGISIHRSRVRPSPDFVAVKGSFKTFLGRPWKKYSRTVFMQTDLDGLIDPVGWGKWGGNFALSTLFYAEYMNTGNGASTTRRVKWPGFHVFNSPEQALPFSVNRFIQGESWIPGSGVPCWLEI